MTASSKREHDSAPPFPGEAARLPPVEEGAELGVIAREFVFETRTQVQAWHDAGASGVQVVREFTNAIDQLIAWLHDSAAMNYRARYVQLDQSCAVLAQGGYGRGELNPRSDIDLLFLYPHKMTPYVETITETILYALWDTRLAVGHAVRTVKDCVRIAGNDIVAKTALIDARYLCGDEPLSGDFFRALEREIKPRATGKFFREKLRESETRRHTYGDSVYLLEPQVKEGQGGLRDLHTAMWIAKIKFKIADLCELAVKGIMNSQELSDIEGAQEFLFRVRNALHFLTGTHQDQLTFDLQEPVAENLGYTASDGDELKPVEHFLRDYYLQATAVTRFANAIIDRTVNPPGPYRLIGRMMARTIRPGVRIVAGELDVIESDLFERDPIELVRVLADAQRHGVKIAPNLADLMRREASLLGEEQRADPELAKAFFGVLRSPYRVYETLHEMHKLGVLAQVMPEWAHLLCLVLHDYYHIYTVDEHSLMGIRELERLRSGERAEALPLLTDVMRLVDKVELLFLGMMLHDIGKGMGGQHSEKGAVLARDIATRFGLNEDDANELEFMVRNHLVLSHLAQRRDIHDEKLVTEVARMVGSPESLKRLYLMTYADMRATGPKVWNNWKDMLLGETYMRVNEVFERGFEPEGRGERVARIQARVRGRVHADDGDDAATRFDDFVASMPDTYFLRTPEHLISKDAELVERCRADGGLALRVTHYDEREFTGFTVAVANCPGLFANLTGVLVASGMNIVGARISTSTDGIAVDSFRISHLDRREIVVDDERWERVERLLKEVLAGETSLDELVARAKKPGLLDTRKQRPAAHGVGVDNAASDGFTIIEVFGRDRVGLLYDIADALNRLGIEIHLAKISTAVDQVLDVFYVTEPAGEKCARDNEIRAVLEPIVRAGLDEPSESIPSVR
ncbi:MAG: [protein-PII] uridylyltransferase [Candidatus Binatia bacterium]|nr:[protein-PII] uridylyltransferase [Candidatus Binatia bacterium]